MEELLRYGVSVCRLHGGSFLGFGFVAGVERDQEEEQEQNYAEDEQAAFGSVCAAAPEWVARGVGGEEVALALEAAVGCAVEKGFSPIPRRVAADGPPRGAGDADADAKDEADEGCGEDANPIFAVVGGVIEAEERGGDPRGLPECASGARFCVGSRFLVEYEAGNETDCGGEVNAACAVASAGECEINAEADLGGERPPEIDSAGERGERVAAKETFLNSRDEEECDGPERAVEECLRGGKRRR